MAAEDYKSFKDAKFTAASNASDNEYQDLKLNTAGSSIGMRTAPAAANGISPQRAGKKPSHLSAAPPAAIADPYGAPPLDSKHGSDSSRARGRRCSPLAWVIFGVMVLVVLGAALGVGLGVGLKSSGGALVPAPGPVPTNASMPTDAPMPSNVSMPTNVPMPTEASMPSNVSMPSDAPVTTVAPMPAVAPIPTDAPSTAMLPCDNFDCALQCKSVSEMQGDCTRCCKR